MYPLKQLLRQPVRTLAALVILTASMAFLCLSWGVYRSGLATAKAVDDSFTTLMAYDNEYLRNNMGKMKMNFKDQDGNISEREVERPLLEVFRLDGTYDAIAAALPQADSLRTLYTHRYLSAVIPGYIPTMATVDSQNSIDVLDSPYNSAVLVFTLTEIEIESDDDRFSFSLKGDIVERPAYNERYPKRDRIVLSGHDGDREMLEKLKSDYGIGKTYIVSLPHEYHDYDSEARRAICAFLSRGRDKVSVEDIDWSKLEIGSQKKPNVVTVGEIIGGVLEHGGRTFGISKSDTDVLGYCGGGMFMDTLASISDGSEKDPFYGNIAEVPGSVEEFLADPDNQVWVDQINNFNADFHATAVFGTDGLSSLLLFADKTMYLSDGEDFSAEDLEKGNSVCIVSESAAYRNGWKVGDRITLNYYSGFPFTSTRHTQALPAVYYQENDVGISCEYEIKGIYRHTNIFSGEPADITPNTVFVPNKNFDLLGLRNPTDENGDPIYWVDSPDLQSMVVKNGRIEDMKAFITEQGWDVKWFLFYDGGYDTVKTTVAGILDSADDQLLASGLTALAAFIIYIALFVMRQRKNVGVMLSLGSGKAKAAGFMVAVSTIPAVIATALGAAIGCGMLRGSVDRVVSEASQQLDTAFSGAAALGNAALENTAVLPSAAVMAAVALLAVYVAAFALVALITVGKNPRELIKK